jgi:hypothetical protein
MQWRQDPQTGNLDAPVPLLGLRINPPTHLQDEGMSAELGSDVVQIDVRLQMIPQIQPPFSSVQTMDILGGEIHGAV